MDFQIRWDTKPPNDQEVKYTFTQGATSFIIVDFHNLNECFQKLKLHLHPFIKYYPWVTSSPILELGTHTFTNKNGVLQSIDYIHLYIINNEEYFDENLLLQLLIDFSTLNKSCFIHSWNSIEYEVLLIHTFDAAPDHLLDRNASMNKTWLKSGDLIILNDHESSNFLPLTRAINQLQNSDYSINPQMTSKLLKAIPKDFNLSNIYDISLKLTNKDYNFILQNPSLISKCIINHNDDFIDQDILECLESVTIPIHAVRLSEIYLQLLHHKDISPGEIASKIITRGLMEFTTDSISSDIELHESTFSRDYLQNELIGQGILSKPIPADLQEFFKSFDFDGLDNDQENALVEEFSGFMDNKSNVDKILKETDILEETDSDLSSDEVDINTQLQDLDKSEFKDFLNYIIENENQGKDKKRKQYNNDSDYQSDSDLDDLKFLAIDHDDYETYENVADKDDVLSDEDDHDDVKIYNDDDDFKERINSFLSSKRNN